jgi:curved DNA-binding protein CbpA
VARRTHYDVLGVASDADRSTIRAAYRRLAREHHPDRAASASSAVGGVDIHDVNEAYRILEDPGRRAMYDAELRSAPADESVIGPAAPRSRRPERSEPAEETVFFEPRERGGAQRRSPWQVIVIVVLLTIAGVVLLSLFANPGEDPPPDGILRVGDCVEFEPDQDAREVRCTGEDDLVVRAFVTFDATCPGLTEPHRDRLGMGVACVDVGR